MAAPTKPGKAPVGIVKRDEEEFQEWVSTEAGFLEVIGSFDDKPIKMEPYQLAFLQTPARYRSVEKARQVGYSWVFSCEALARSHLHDTHNSIFVSYNLADAKEKIAYVGQMHEELPLEFQKKRVVDSKLEIGFRSNRSHGRISRIISNPSKAPRGKKGDIYLDELAHCANDREIYKGSTALILRSRGQLTVCSSPLGRRGQFWEIARQELQPYPAYWRQRVPWWLCSQFCTDPLAASKLAPAMDTIERVAKFGTSDIQSQLASLATEDFQQEFEVAYSDETLSYFPYEIILPCTSDDVLPVQDYAAITFKQGRLTAGFDVGRKKDLAVLVILEEIDGMQWVRCIRVFDRVAFQVMENDLKLMLDTLPIARLSIDGTGMGMQLAESMRASHPQVVEETFTTQSKEVWCTDLKIRLQQQKIKLPKDRALVSEIHSIKKRVTAAGRIVFSAERTSGGHADRFWALALAARKERGELASPVDVGVSVAGEEAKPTTSRTERAAAILKRREARKPKAPAKAGEDRTDWQRVFDESDELTPVVIMVISTDEDALRALDATIRQLPGEHELLAFTAGPDGGVPAASSDPNFLRYACENQGYAHSVIIDGG